MLRSPVFVLARAGVWRAMGGSTHQNMVGSEPTRFSSRCALAVLARAGVPARAGGSVMRCGGPGVCWGPGARCGGPGTLGARCALVGPGARWRGLARAGFLHTRGPGALGLGFPWRLTRSRLCLGRCCGLRVVAGLPVCGITRGGERHVLLRSYVVGVHWVRAYACVALGEWRTDAASEEVYVGAGGGIASVA